MFYKDDFITKQIQFECEDIGTIEMTINEYKTKKAIAKLIKELLIYSFEISEAVNQDNDTSIFVLYDDGSSYYRTFGIENGEFKTTHIKAVAIDDGYEYYTYGKYEINEYGVLSV